MSLNKTALQKKWIEQQMIQEVNMNNEIRLAFKRRSTQNLIWKKVKSSHHLGLGYCDIMEIALEHAVNAVLTFKCKDSTKQWCDILDGDQEQNNKLWKAIEISLRWNLSNVDPLAKRTYENKTKTHVIIKPYFSSLDQTVNGQDGEAMKQAHLVTEKNRLWGSNDYQTNELNQWFWNHAREVLTAKQLKFIQDFRTGSVGDRSGYIKRIRAKILEEQKRQGWVMFESNLERQLNKKINILKKVMKIIETDDALEYQNKQVESWIKEHISLDWLDELVFATLEKKDYQKLLMALSRENLIPTSIIYKIADAVLTKLQYFQAFETSLKPARYHLKLEDVEAANRVITENVSPYEFKTKVRILLPTGITVEEASYLESQKW